MEGRVRRHSEGQPQEGDCLGTVEASEGLEHPQIPVADTRAGVVGLAGMRVPPQRGRSDLTKRSSGEREHPGVEGAERPPVGRVNPWRAASADTLDAMPLPGD